MSTIGKKCPIQAGVICSEECAWLTSIVKKTDLDKSCALVSLAEDLSKVYEAVEKLHIMLEEKELIFYD